MGFGGTSNIMVAHRVSVLLVARVTSGCRSSANRCLDVRLICWSCVSEGRVLGLKGTGTDVCDPADAVGRLQALLCEAAPASCMIAKCSLH